MADKNQNGELGQDITVSLSSLDSTHFKNYRTDIPLEKIVGLREDIRRNGLMQNPVVGKSIKEGVYPVVAGYCRTEAMRQLCLEEVVNEFNAVHELKPNSKDYVRLEEPAHRQRVREAGDDWKKKFDDALQSYEIAVKLRDDVVTTHQAALLNLVENEQRDKPSLSDLIFRVAEMSNAKDENGKKVFKAKDIAASIKKSEPFISQVRKIAKLFEQRSVLFDKAAKKMGEPENVVKLMKTQWETAFNELDRRARLPRADKCAIQYKSLREFADAFLNTKEPLDLKQALNVLCQLVQLDETGKPTKLPVLDTSVFKRILDDAKAGAREVTKEELEEAAPEAEVDAVAEVAEEQAAAITEDEELSSEENLEDIQEEDSEEDEDVGDEDEFANEEAEDIDSEEAAVVEEGDDDDLAPAKPSVDKDAGEMATKTKAAPEEKYRTKQPSALEAMAINRIKDAKSQWGDADNPPVERLASLAAATELYDAIGLNDEANETNQMAVDFGDALAEYIQFMEELILSKAKEDTRRKMEEFAEQMQLALGILDESGEDDAS